MSKVSNFQTIQSASFLLKVVFWAACFVFGFLCLIPTSYLQPDLFNWWDKAQHIFAFFCLSCLGVLAYQKKISRVAINLFFYGGLIEILQWLIGWRSGELLDLLADGLGVFFGIVFMKILIHNRVSLLKTKMKA